MVSTRAKRRRIFYGEDHDNNEDEEYQQLAEALAESLETQKQLTKKRRKDQWKRNYPPIEMLHVELLPKIFSYLDNAKEVYQLSLYSKSFARAITPELVVKVAVFNGGKSKAVIERIMRSVKNKSIYIPSIFRLLRLVLATRCERDDECCAYDLVKKKASWLEKPTQRPFSLSICGTCLQGVSGRPHIYNSSSLIKNDRIEVFNHTMLLSQAQVENSTGENIGSLVLFKHVKQIESTHYEEGKRKELFDECVVRLEQNISTEDRNLSQVYIIAFNTAMIEYDLHVNRKKMVLIANQKAKEAKRASRKRELSQPVYNKIEVLLKAFKHKDLVLTCVWNDAGFATFDHWPSKLTLGSLLSAPSSATTSKINNGAKSVKEIFTLLESNGLIGDSFPRLLISSLYPREDWSKAQIALTMHCANEKTPEDLLRLFSNHNYINNYIKMAEALRGTGGTQEALFWALESYNDKQDVFVYGVVSDDLSDEMKMKMKKLAGKVWNRRNNQYAYGLQSNPRTFDDFQAKYDECEAAYSDFNRLIYEYKNLPITIAWLKETTPPENRNQTFSRMDAIDTLYDYRSNHVLEGRLFSSLRSMHRNMFRFPEDHNLPLRPIRP